MSKHSNRKRNFKKILIILLSCIFISCIIFIIIFNCKEYIDNKRQKEISQVLDTIEVSKEIIQEEKTERMLQVEELQKENSDIIGWIEIEGTNINYPVLQGEDNDYYLNHDYKKQKVSGGSIFLDKDYDFSIPSSNLLIYGHRHKKGLMFEDLINYKKEKFYKDHSIIRFTTVDEDCEYEIIAAFNSRVYYQNETNVFRYYYFVNANNEEEYNEFIKNSKNASLYDIDKTATYGEQLLTLSTCDYSQKNGRFAVVAKKIPKDKKSIISKNSF